MAHLYALGNRLSSSIRLYVLINGSTQTAPVLSTLWEKFSSLPTKIQFLISFGANEFGCEGAWVEVVAEVIVSSEV